MTTVKWEKVVEGLSDAYYDYLVECGWEEPEKVSTFYVRTPDNDPYPYDMSPPGAIEYRMVEEVTDPELIQLLERTEGHVMECKEHGMVGMTSEVTTGFAGGSVYIAMSECGCHQDVDESADVMAAR